MINKKYFVYAALLALAGFVVYKANQQEKPSTPTYPPVVRVDVIGPVGGATPEVVEQPEVEPVVTLPEVTITGKVPAQEPVLHGTERCRWYGEVGLQAVNSREVRGDLIDPWQTPAETTCEENACFLLVFDTGKTAGFVMHAWIKEARRQGHDPRKDEVQLSVFVFENGKAVDHILYDPTRDEFTVGL